MNRQPICSCFDYSPGSYFEPESFGDPRSCEIYEHRAAAEYEEWLDSITEELVYDLEPNCESPTLDQMASQAEIDAFEERMREDAA